MPRLAPDIFPKRLLIEGYLARPTLDAEAIREYFSVITSRAFFELTEWDTAAF